MWTATTPPDRRSYTQQQQQQQQQQPHEQEPELGATEVDAIHAAVAKAAIPINVMSQAASPTATPPPAVRAVTRAASVPHHLPSSVPRNFGFSLVTSSARRSPVIRALPFSAAHTQSGGSPRRFGHDFVQLQDLGRGAFGRVIKVKHKLDGNLYAVKQLRIQRNSDETKILREVSTLSRLSHPHVVRYYQAWIEEGAQPVADGDDDDDLQSDTDESESDVSRDSMDSFLPCNFMVPSNGLPSPPQRKGRRARRFEVTATLARCEDCQRPFVPWKAQLLDLTLDPADDSLLCRECFLNRLTLTGKFRAARDLISFVEKPPEPPKLARFLFIQMEYCQLTLVDLINEKLLRSSQLVWHFFRQILEGLHYVHSQGIVHRDMKPANLFLSGSALGLEHLEVAGLKELRPQQLQKLQLRIGDFGLAKAAPNRAASAEDSFSLSLISIERMIGSRLDSSVSNFSRASSEADSSRPSTPDGLDEESGFSQTPSGSGMSMLGDNDDTTDIGTFFYVPPDLNGSWTRKADMYGVGVILFEMFYPCTTGMERLITLRELRRKSTTFPQGFEKSNFEAAITIRRLLQRDPESRPTADELLGQVPCLHKSRLQRSDSSPALSAMVAQSKPSKSGAYTPNQYALPHAASEDLAASMPTTPARLMAGGPSAQDDRRMDLLLSLYSITGSFDSVDSGSFSLPDTTAVSDPVASGGVSLSSSAPDGVLRQGGQNGMQSPGLSTQASEDSIGSPPSSHFTFGDCSPDGHAAGDGCTCCSTHRSALRTQAELIGYLNKKLEAKNKEVEVLRALLGHGRSSPSNALRVQAPVPGLLRSTSVGQDTSPSRDVSRVRSVLSPPGHFARLSVGGDSLPETESVAMLGTHPSDDQCVTPPLQIKARKVQSARR